MKPGGSPDAKWRVGLARTLSKHGYCSRAQGFALVRSGQVAVNGRQRRDPEFPIGEGNKVTVGGQPGPVGVKSPFDDEQAPWRRNDRVRRKSSRNRLFAAFPGIALGCPGWPARSSQRRPPTVHERFGMGGANYSSRVAHREDLSRATGSDRGAAARHQTAGRRCRSRRKSASCSGVNSSHESEDLMVRDRPR